MSGSIKSAREGGWGSPVVAGGMVYLFAHVREQIRELGERQFPWLPPDKRVGMSEEEYAGWPDRSADRLGCGATRRLAVRDRIHERIATSPSVFFPALRSIGPPRSIILCLRHPAEIARATRRTSSQGAAGRSPDNRTRKGVRGTSR